MPIKKQHCVIILFCLLATACATKPTSKPLDSQSSTAKILAKSPTSTAFQQYLMQHGYNEEELPLTNWGIDELTLSALFHHTALDVAKQQLALSNLAIATAGTKNRPTINGEIARSDQRNEDLKPWAYGLSIDIPIATNNKRGIKIEKATQNAEIARMNAAETAWQLRNQIAIDLLAYHQNLAEIKLWRQAFNTQQDIASMLEKRVNAGIASSTEFNNASLLALKAKHQLNNKQAQTGLTRAKLAADVGLTSDQFSAVSIQPLSVKNTIDKQMALLTTPLESKKLQEQALLNRIDIRRSIAQYASAEAEVRLQAAHTIPDITISPGILFEFGDKIWSLGFSSLLNLLQKNTALIAEAKQLREIEGAQFEHLQAKIIAQINQAHAHYQAAKQTAEQADEELAKQIAQEQKMQKQLSAGLIGKLDMAQYTRNTLIARQQQLASQFSLLNIANQIENLMQKPLYSSFKMPTSTGMRLDHEQ